MLYALKQELKDKTLVKIGYTTGIKNRMTAHYSTNPDIKLLAVMPGSREDEKLLHNRLQQHHYKGDDDLNEVEKITDEDSDLKNDFIEWLDATDDELFNETCEKLSPKFIQAFDTLLDQEEYSEAELAKYIETFCTVFESVVEKKVEDLHFAYVNECDEIQKTADAKKEETRKKYEELIKKYTEDLPE